MPVRRKANRRRTSATIDAWETALECEFDFFDGLRDADIHVDDYGRPDRREAEAAWREFGAVLMERWLSAPGGLKEEPWALTEFGAPVMKRRPGR